MSDCTTPRTVGDFCLTITISDDLVVGEEVDKVTLVRFENYLTAEGVDSELFDDLKKVDLFVELLLRVIVQIVLSSRLDTTATATW